MKKHTTHILKIQLYYITIKQIVLIQSNIKKSKKSMLIVMTYTLNNLCSLGNILMPSVYPAAKKKKKNLVGVLSHAILCVGY